MLNTLRRAFTRTRTHCQQPPAPTIDGAQGFEGLPPFVRVDLDLAEVTLRNGCAADEPRALIHLPGNTPWIDSAEDTPKAVARMYPELAPGQVETVSRYLRRLARHRKRINRRLSRPNWATTWTWQGDWKE